MTKKSFRNFCRENGNFVRKNLIQKSWSARNFSVPPKLVARSPPLCSVHVTTTITITNTTEYLQKQEQQPPSAATTITTTTKIPDGTAASITTTTANYDYTASNNILLPSTLIPHQYYYEHYCRLFLHFSTIISAVTLQFFH